MNTTTNTSKNTTPDFEDKAVKGAPSAAEKVFGTSVKPMFSKGKKSPVKTAFVAALLVLLFAAPVYLQGMGEAFLLSALLMVGLFTISALGLNIVVGYAGMLDFGRMAFYAVGAYAAAIISIPLASLLGPSLGQLTFPIALVGAGIVAAFVGWLLSLPVMRLRGDYLAIVTLGFGEIVRITIQNNPFGITNGMMGLPSRGDSLPAPPLFDWLRENVVWAISNTDFYFTVTRNVYWYYIVLIVLIIAVVIIHCQDNSRLGRSWAAMREDEVAATAMGVNVTRAKTWAFVLGSFWGGVAGACYLYLQQTVTPEPFNFFNSVLVLAIVVIGGMGSIPGVLLGGFLILGFPEIIRWFAMNHLTNVGADIPSLVSSMRNLLLGLFMVLMMAVRTEGLIPMKPKLYKLFGKSDPSKGDCADAGAQTAPKGGASS
jgi:branched-chain amino acid transport system permease protein